MKHLFTLLLMAITFTGVAQISPPAVPKAGTKQATTNQAYIYRSSTGDTTRLYLRLGASGITADYYEISNNGGGGVTIDTNRLMYLDKNQSVPAFKSFQGRLNIDNTLNVTGAALSVTAISGATVIDASGSAGSKIFNGSTTTAIGIDVVNVSSTLPTLKISNLSTGDHAQFGSTSGKIATVVNSGNIITPKASASNHVVIKSQLDSVGALVIGTGTVTSFGKVDGYGITSSVANPTTTPVHTISVDSTVIASKQYVDTLIKYTTNNIIKDFYGDSTASTTTYKRLYSDTLIANKLDKVGDKITFMSSGVMDVDVINSDNYFSVFFGGVGLSEFIIQSPTLGAQPFEINTTIMRTGASNIRVSSTMNMSFNDGTTYYRTIFYQGSGFSFSSPIEISFMGKLGTLLIGTIRARMGYIEFKPASL